MLKLKKIKQMELSDANFVCGCGGSGTTAIALDISAASNSIILPFERHELYFAWRELYEYKETNESEVAINQKKYESLRMQSITDFNELTGSNWNTNSVVDHTPVNIHAANHIKDLYPRNKFIFVIRHPFNTIKGLVKRWANPTIGKPKNLDECIEQAATRWINCAREIEKNLDKTDDTLIKYEDYSAEWLRTSMGISDKLFIANRKILLDFIQEMHNRHTPSKIKNNTIHILEERSDINSQRIAQLADGFKNFNGTAKLSKKIDLDILNILRKKEMGALAKKYGYNTTEVEF